MAMISDKMDTEAGASKGPMTAQCPKLPLKMSCALSLVGISIAPIPIMPVCLSVFNAVTPPVLLQGRALLLKPFHRQGAEAQWDAVNYLASHTDTTGT